VQFGFRQVDRGQFDEARSVSFVTGCALLLPRRTLERVGYLDERFFSYFEDVDFSIRIEREVGKLWYCPAAKLWHKVGAGANTRAYTPYYLYYQTRNRLWVFGRGRNFFLKARFFLLNFVLYFLGRLGYILVSKSENKGLQVQAVVLGFFHSLVGKRGRNIRWEV
jgi:GT2 family glycosyltransferase